MASDVDCKQNEATCSKKHNSNLDIFLILLFIAA